MCKLRMQSAVFGILISYLFLTNAEANPVTTTPYNSTSHSSSRMVSFWYVPDPSDVNDTLADLTTHRASITNIQLYCGHGVQGDGSFVNTTLPICDGGLLTTLRNMGLRVEFVINDFSTNVTAHKIFMNNPNSITAMVAIAVKYKLFGWNIDLEPQSVPAVASDAVVYAAFCTKLRRALNAVGTRLTIDVATWSPMLSQFTLLAPTVDRMMNMETYNANSMQGWLTGDNWGGYYTSFVNAHVQPRSACGVGMGAWPATCGTNVPCWSTTSVSGPPRLQRVLQDNVTEIAVWRIVGKQNPSNPNGNTPIGWWWAILAQFLSS
eukprot:PhF_6_TR19040/c0_g1_i2/m.27973